MLSNSTLGSLLKKEREKRNLPLRKVAAVLDVDQSVISKIETSKRKATRDQVVALAKFFDLDKDELIQQYISEVIANEILDEANYQQILIMAEEKVKYFKNNKMEQASIRF